MSLDIYLVRMVPTEVFEANITHNLTRMATEAGICAQLWSPEEAGIVYAEQLVEPLRKGIKLMKADPERFKAFNAANGWGMYEHFVPWLEELLKACEKFPDAEISVSR